MKRYHYTLLLMIFALGKLNAGQLTSTPPQLAPVTVFGFKVSDREKAFQEASSLSLLGTMKDHFRLGMRFFMKDKYNEAIPELIASTMITEPHTWNYWYAEAYATLGVIYEFHRDDENHKKLAIFYYKLALKFDPRTFSARYYVKKMKPYLDVHSKKRI